MPSGVEDGKELMDLSFDELRGVSVALVQAALAPRMNTVITSLHQQVWAWKGELLLGHNATYSADRWSDDSVGSLVALVDATLAVVLFDSRLPLEAALAHAGGSMSKALWHQVVTLRELTFSRSVTDMQKHQALIWAHLSFPLLEGVVKRACRTHVAMDGTVRAGFAVASRKYPVGGRNVSNLSHLLELRYKTGSPELQRDLDEIRTHIGSVATPSADGFKIIFDWRNSSLHGQQSIETVGGTVLGLALLIALHDTASSFETDKDQAASAVRHGHGLYLRS